MKILDLAILKTISDSPNGMDRKTIYLKLREHEVTYQSIVESLVVLVHDKLLTEEANHQVYRLTEAGLEKLKGFMK